MLMPAGISSSQVRKAAVLYEFLRRLPLMPRILRSATCFSPGLAKSGEFTASGGRGGVRKGSGGDGGARRGGLVRGSRGRCAPLGSRSGGGGGRDPWAGVRAGGGGG